MEVLGGVTRVGNGPVTQVPLLVTAAGLIADAVDSVGTPLCLAAMSVAITYDGDDIDFIEYSDGTDTWKVEYAYTDAKLVSIGLPVKQ